jgi:hypothetical protein
MTGFFFNPQKSQIEFVGINHQDQSRIKSM